MHEARRTLEAREALLIDTFNSFEDDVDVAELERVRGEIAEVQSLMMALAW